MAKTLSGKNLSKIGIGSYGIGGIGHRNNFKEDCLESKFIDALLYQFRKGLNFSEIALGYADGRALRLFKKALEKSTIDRKDVFITHSLYPTDLPTFDVVKEDIEQFYKVMDSDYADSTLVTLSLIKKFGKREFMLY